MPLNRADRLPINRGIERNNVKGAGNAAFVALTPLEEESLIHRAQSGDDEAFWSLVEPHLHRIYAAAARITRNHEDAEDVCQECLVKAFTHIQTFRKDAKISTWLTRISINESLMFIRKRKAELRHVRFDKDFSEIPSILQMRSWDADSDPEALWAQGERNEILWEAVNQLGEDFREAIHMFGAGEMRTREIGNALQLTHSGVKTRLRRGLRSLRSILSESLGGGDAPIRGWI
jgi:RNA polymerase sigma-70 factor (ECF subfamily)